MLCTQAHSRQIKESAVAESGECFIGHVLSPESFSEDFLGEFEGFNHIMNRRNDPNPFDEEEQEVNPFSNGGNAPGSKSRIPQMVANTLGFGQKHDATVDIPLDSMNDPKKKQKELAAWEADLKRRERDIKRREDAVAGGKLCDTQYS
nr:secretory carrier-associated membrane protein 4-like [Ipomoea batatas]